MVFVASQNIYCSTSLLILHWLLLRLIAIVRACDKTYLWDLLGGCNLEANPTSNYSKNSHFHLPNSFSLVSSVFTEWGAWGGAVQSLSLSRRLWRTPAISLFIAREETPQQKKKPGRKGTCPLDTVEESQLNLEKTNSARDSSTLTSPGISQGFHQNSLWKKEVSTPEAINEKAISYIKILIFAKACLNQNFPQFKKEENGLIFQSDMDVECVDGDWPQTQRDELLFVLKHFSVICVPVETHVCFLL